MSTQEAVASVDLSPRASNLAKLPPGFLAPSLDTVVRRVDGGGLAQSVEGIRRSLDFQTDADRDAAAGRTGAALAAAKATRSLQADLAFHDVTVGMASDWFREVKTAMEKRFRPTSSDLNEPRSVSRAAILDNFLKDPTSWDDEAKRVLTPLLQAQMLHSTDPLKRLPLSNSANLATVIDSQLRRSTIEDLLTRRVAGLSVRVAFELDVHHDGDGTITAIDVLRGAAERVLEEKVRMAIDDAIHDVTPVPSVVSGGRPFVSRWLLAATWFLEPPGCLLDPADVMGASGGSTGLRCGGSFDPMNPKNPLDVQHKVTAELLHMRPLGR